MRKVKSIAKALMQSLRERKENLCIRKAIKNNLNRLKIIVGSASTSQSGWVSTNYPLLDLTDESTFRSLFKRTESVDRFLAEHVWEHLTSSEAELAARNCHDYLKSGGIIRVAVPDGYHPDPDYIAQVKPGGYGPGADDHKVLYNYRSLTQLFVEQGYEVSLLEWFDENGVFHHLEWSPDDGMVQRSFRYDPRNKTSPKKYTSIIIDAQKPL